MQFLMIGLLAWHIFSVVILVVLGSTIRDRPSMRGLAFALALVNAGYIMTYALILVDTNLVGYAWSNWLTTWFSG